MKANKKIKKFLNLISLSLLSTACLAIPSFSTSCSYVYPPANFSDEHIQYIYNRSFSLFCQYTDAIDGKSYCAWGTTWILSKVNDSKSNGDYWYYLATNYHVIVNTLTSLSTNSYFYISDYYNGEYSALDNGLRVRITEIELDKDYFSYTDPASRDSSIDFVVLKVNLEPVTRSTSGKTIKQKIDKLNELQEQQGYINKFKKTTTSDPDTIKNCYCAGFPAVIDTNKCNTIFRYIKIPKVTIDRNITHQCLEDDGSETAKAKIEKIGQLTDISWNYYSDAVDKSSFQLTGGASGSMIIDDNFNVIGIYWGGLSFINTFKPHFTIFDSEQKDFTIGYINQ